LWLKIKDAYAGAVEDQKIDASNDLKFFHIEDKETVNNYIARGLATKYASLSLNVTPRELVYYTVRKINNQYKDIREILKTQREKSLEEIYEILKEREKESQRRGNHLRETENVYAFQKKKMTRDAISVIKAVILQRCIGTVKITKKVITKLPIIATDETGRRTLIRAGEM